MKKLLFSLLSKFPSGIALMLLLIVLTGTSCQKTAVSEQTPVTASNVAEAKIGTQRWMARNLNVSRYRNGDVIPQVTDQTKWAALTTGAWCYYNNDPANGAVYGKLYNWYAVNDPRGLAPTGWHVPSDAEWDTLVIHLGNYDVGGRLKDTGTIEAGTGLWRAPNTGATNRFGFTALPGGCRFYLGSFSRVVGEQGFWWTSTEYNINTKNAWRRALSYKNGNLSRYNVHKVVGYSVRCIKD